MFVYKYYIKKARLELDRVRNFQFANITKTTKPYFYKLCTTKNVVIIT